MGPRLAARQYLAVSLDLPVISLALSAPIAPQTAISPSLSDSRSRLFVPEATRSCPTWGI
jgi:hypothetical protein